MSIRTKFIGILALVICVGCHKVPDRTLTLIADSSDNALIEHTRVVLQERFIDLKPSYFSSEESNANGSHLIFTFKNGEPSRATLEFLYKSRGGLRAMLLPDSMEILTNRDIATVEPYYRDSRRMLYFKLKEEAGKRLGEISSKNSGKEFQIIVDGQVILNTRIDGSFSDAFKADSTRMDYMNVEALAAVLKSGVLPVTVSIADVNK